MKTYNRLALLAIAGILLVAPAGCKTFFRYKYGMSEPREETPQALVSFLEKNRFPDSNMFMFADSASYFEMMRNTIFRKNLLSHMIFDRNGDLAERDTTHCQWSGKALIASLRPDTSMQKWPGLQLGRLLPHLVPFGRLPRAGSSAVNPDFTIVVTWAKFIGRYNYRLFDLAAAVKQNKKARIRVIWLNIDVQKDWHVPEKQMMKIR